MTTKTKAIGYWATTGLLALSMGGGGAAQLAHAKDNVEGIVHLGYPVYFLTILGIWKLLGVAALLAPGLPRLKEWAYAGFFFAMTGATASHLACGDPTWHSLVTVTLCGLTVASWALRPASRTLGATSPPRA
jgi:DoxX-like family